jgi:hypothetical protein
MMSMGTSPANLSEYATLQSCSDGIAAVPAV